MLGLAPDSFRAIFIMAAVECSSCCQVLYVPRAEDLKGFCSCCWSSVELMTTCCMSLAWACQIAGAEH